MCRERGHSKILLTSCNKRSQLAGKKIAARHSDAALHHENSEVLKQVSNRSLGIKIPGCFQDWTIWAPWQTDLVLKPDLFWNDLQNLSSEFPHFCCTPLHLGHNSVLISKEVMLICQKYFYFSINRSSNFPLFITYFIIGTCIFPLSILNYVNKLLEITGFIRRDRDHNSCRVIKTNNQTKGCLEFW